MATITSSEAPTPTDKPITQITPRRRKRSYPAGRAIAVVLLALFIAAVLDADSLVASISSERFGTARNVELDLTRPLRWVADHSGLNLPHQWLADIAGTNHPRIAPAVPSRPPAPPTSAATAASTTKALRALIGGAVGLGSVTAPPPKPRVPTATSPVKIWLAGDSLMGMLADTFIAHETGNPAVIASSDVQIGTGLARPDVYDWAGAVSREVQQAQPSVVVLTFGANDDQSMLAGGQYVTKNTPAWQAEYGRRIDQIVNEVASPSRLLVWVEVPPVARPGLQLTDTIINGLLRSHLANRKGVLLLNPTPAIAPGGTFTPYLPGPGGQVQVRTPDGVHMTTAGAGRVLPLLVAFIRTAWTIS